ncbi:hypothetical protein Avbf_09815 [Armadillidium vulgare]|nr:hypothetical protein Avbf_09815 [Armadillidium vulgare]
MKKVDPYKKALMYWVKSVQNFCYSKEIEFLKSDPKNSDGILRSKGIISKCTYFNYDVHNPVILSRFHYFTTLLILRSHQKVQHLGVDSTLTHIRNQGYWIPKVNNIYRIKYQNFISSKRFNLFAALFNNKICKNSFHNGKLNNNNEIARASEIISEATNILVMTGAGLSTPSGIPDFRKGLNFSQNLQ